jgi:hypothetical protein
MLYVSNDGYVRLTVLRLQAITLRHLVSGVDDCLPGKASATDTQTGYTEFISAPPAALTLGWDWRLDRSQPCPALTRVDEPHSNIMLVTHDHIDLGPHTTAMLLAAFVDTLPWQAPTFEYLEAIILSGS